MQNAFKHYEHWKNSVLVPILTVNKGRVYINMGLLPRCFIEGYILGMTYSTELPALVVTPTHV